MFDIENQIIRVFRIAIGYFIEPEFLLIQLKLLEKHHEDNLQYSAPLAFEIDGLIVDDLGHVDRQHDVIVEYNMEGLKHISVLYPSFIAMQYLILSPCDDGFKMDIKYRELGQKHIVARQYITKREFYAYRIQQKDNEGKILKRVGRLF